MSTEENFLKGIISGLALEVAAIVLVVVVLMII